METIAVYWEDPVKVYSISEKTQLDLAILHIPSAEISKWSDRISSLETFIKRFELITAHGSHPDKFEIFIVIDQGHTEVLQNCLHKWLEGDVDSSFSLRRQVAMCYLHGPHFQDRYGIADLAFTTFAENDIEIVLAGCAGTSMYLVTDMHDLTEGKRLLLETFVVPGS